MSPQHRKYVQALAKALQRFAEPSWHIDLSDEVQQLVKATSELSTVVDSMLTTSTEKGGQH